MSLLEDLHPQAYAAAKHLLDHGVPLFLAKRSSRFPAGGANDCGYHLPKQWQKTEPDSRVLSRWKPSDALCALMGRVVDAVDIDPRNGGTEGSWMPTSYGRANTPSGGTHDLIASIGVRTRAGTLPGVDVQAGVEGVGTGFIFLAPTEKMSKSTGQVGSYIWETEPDLSELALIGGDDSGSRLFEIVSSGRGRVGADYSGPGYQDLPEHHRQTSDECVDTQILDWKMRLADASTWSEGERDYRGRGWEALSRDCAWTIAKLAVCPWTRISEEDAQEVYIDTLHADIAADPKCRGKWYEGLLEKAAAQPVDLPPWWAETFFEQTEILSQIQTASQSRILAPSGVLAMILARILIEVPPSCMLPAAVGSRASLNLGIAIVANSGGGKSASIKVSREILGMYGLAQEAEGIERPAGSGEGLAEAFLQPELMENAKGEMKPTGKKVLADDPRAMFIVNEIETLESLGSGRAGSTLMSSVREMLTGDGLGQTNAEAGGRTRRVPEGKYRAVLLVGVQPKRSDILLNEREVGVGTPQRLLWCSAMDSNHPDDEPSWPGSLDWEPPSEWPVDIEYPLHIRNAVVTHRKQVLRGKAGDLEGHQMLLQLKIAFALAVLHGETKIDDRWWTLAATLVSTSVQIQKECQETLSATIERRVIRQEINRAKAVEEATEVVSSTRLHKACDAIMVRLQKQPGEVVSWKDARPASRLLRGLETEHIVDMLENDEDYKRVKVETYDAQGRTAYRLQYDA